MNVIVLNFGVSIYYGCGDTKDKVGQNPPCPRPCGAASACALPSVAPGAGDRTRVSRFVAPTPYPLAY